MTINKWWGFSKKRNHIPTPESVKALQTAEIKLEEAQLVLNKATEKAEIMKTERETNHFRERYILALKGQ